MILRVRPFRRRSHTSAWARVHEIDDTPIAALDRNRSPGMDDMFDSAMNDIRVSEINDLSSAIELLGKKMA